MRFANKRNSPKPRRPVAAHWPCGPIGPKPTSTWATFCRPNVNLTTRSPVIRRAPSLKPRDVEAFSNLGNALRSSGRLDEAIAAFQTCVALQPDFYAAHCNLGNALKDAGQIVPAIECFRRAVELNPRDVISQSNLAYSVYYHPDYDSTAILAEARRWDAMHAPSLRSGDARERSRSRTPPADRLRRRRFPRPLPVAVHNSAVRASRSRAVRDCVLRERRAARRD